MRNIIPIIVLVLIVDVGMLFAHDTTHIHPLITAKIRQLIQDNDLSDKTYLDIYKLDPNPVEEVPPQDQFLYWGTDFDPKNLAPLNTPNSPAAEAYLLSGTDSVKDYDRYNNVIDGVVQEDVPFTKVLNHFYHARTGVGLRLNGITVGDPSSIRAMRLFNESIDWMGGYTEEAKHAGFFMFGQALHHVEDMITPSHIHNNSENALFSPMRRYGQLKNTHVVSSTLRFLNGPCLALKQTEYFQSTKSRVKV